MANSNINIVSIPTANISSNNVAFLSVLYSSNTGRMIYLNNVFTYFVSTLSNTNINFNKVNTFSNLVSYGTLYAKGSSFIEGSMLVTGVTTVNNTIVINSPPDIRTDISVSGNVSATRVTSNTIVNRQELFVYGNTTVNNQITASTLVANTANISGNVILGGYDYNTVTFKGRNINCSNELSFNANTITIDATNRRVSINGNPQSYNFEVYGNQFIYDRTQPFLGLGNTTSDYVSVYYNPSNKTGYLGTTGTNTYTVIRSNGSNIMYFSNNNVGIGNVNPDTKLVVDGSIKSNATSFALQAYTSGSTQTSIGIIKGGGTANQKTWEILNDDSFKIRTVNDNYTNSQDVITITRGTGVNVANVLIKNIFIDSKNNMGIGAIPTVNWGISNVIVSSSLLAFVGENGQVVTNSYYDGSSWRTQTTGFSSLYIQLDGKHSWWGSTSNTAGGITKFYTAMSTDQRGNLLLRADPGAVTSGNGVFYIKNADAVPSTASAGGGVLFVENGALKYRGSSNTVTTIALA